MRRLYHTLTGASTAFPPGQALSQLLALGSAKFSPTEVPKIGPSAEDFNELLVLRFVSNLEHCRDEAQAGAGLDQETLRDTCLRGAALLLASNVSGACCRDPKELTRYWGAGSNRGYGPMLRLLLSFPVRTFLNVFGRFSKFKNSTVNLY